MIAGFAVTVLVANGVLVVLSGWFCTVEAGP